MRDKQWVEFSVVDGQKRRYCMNSSKHNRSWKPCYKHAPDDLSSGTVTEALFHNVPASDETAAKTWVNYEADWGKSVPDVRFERTRPVSLLKNDVDTLYSDLRANFFGPGDLAGAQRLVAIRDWLVAGFDADNEINWDKA